MQDLAEQWKLPQWGMMLVAGTCLFGCLARLPAEGIPRAGTYKHQMTIKAAEGRRGYVVHVPRGYDHIKAYPLVVVIHGAFSTAREIAAHSGFSVLADQEGFLVLYPNGIGLFGFLRHWNSGHCCGKAWRQDIDDVAFLAAAIENVSRRFTVDRSRIYMVGNSNGGMLTYRFAAERSEMLAAIAPVSATIGGQPEHTASAWRIPPPQMTMPVIAFHGRQDEVVVYAGSRSKRQRGTLTWISVAESIAFWVTHNHLQSSPVSERLHQGRILRQTWSDNAGGPDVVLYTIEQWGHVWPGHYVTDKLATSDALRGFDAAELMWEFFKRYRRFQPESKTADMQSECDGCR